MYSMKASPTKPSSLADFRPATTTQRTFFNGQPKNNKLASAKAKQILISDFIPFLQPIFEDSSDCVAIFALDETIVYLNKSLEQTLGYNLKQAQTQLQPNTENFIAYRQALRKVMQTGLSDTILLDLE